MQVPTKFFVPISFSKFLPKVFHFLAMNSLIIHDHVGMGCTQPLSSLSPLKFKLDGLFWKFFSKGSGWTLNWGYVPGWRDFSRLTHNCKQGQTSPGFNGARFVGYQGEIRMNICSHLWV